jgi:hypothetical protein
MARTVRDAKLEKWEQRKSLKPKRHYRDIGDGIALCYRRGAGAALGTWSVRIRGTDGRYSLISLGVADDNVLPADGERVLTYRQACTKAIEEAARGPKSAYTVGDAIDDYMVWFREHRKAVEATEATIRTHIRPALGDKPIASLTATELKEWRDRLARSKARRRGSMGQIGRASWWERVLDGV